FEGKGKLYARVRVARMEEKLAFIDFEIKKMEIIMNARKIFFALLLKQEKEKVAKEFLSLARKTLQIVKEKVQAGKESPLEEN
ncbi:TolC family protein, partial [Candidatus Riflebacteria bacterium]